MSISVTLTPKRRLEQALKQADITVTHLTVFGMLTSKDFWYIRENMHETLQKIDMSSASVEGDIIDCSAFYYCIGLTSVVLPETITKIRSGAFSGCENLTSFTIPASVTENNEKFSGCTSLTYIKVHPQNPVYKSVDGVLFSKNMSRLKVYPRGRKGDYIIPNSVEVIEGWAFENCADLTSVFIPHSVVNIEGYAFTGCSGLTSVKIPDSVENIGRWAFSHCSGLKSVNIPASVTAIEGYVFSDCAGITSITIPDTVRMITNGAFSGCSGLRSVMIPVSVRDIEGAFEGCTGITSFSVYSDNPVYACKDGVIFNKRKDKLILYPKGRQGEYVVPNSVTEIEDWAFSDSIGLTSIIIPNSVTKIGRRAFGGCNRLTSLAIPESVVDMHQYTFTDCIGLTNIAVHSDNPCFASENGVLFNKNKTVLIFCPTGLQGDYVIPDTVEIIEDGAFSDCTGLTSVFIPDKVCAIDVKDFNGCNGLISFTVHSDNSVFASVDGALFNKDKTSLRAYPQGRQGDYIIPNTVKQIGIEAFYRCEGLTSVIIPASVTHIGIGAFYACFGLTSVTIPASVVEIGKSAFCACIGLKSITIPDSVENIENGVFWACTALTSVVIPDSVKQIKNDAFRRCLSLTSVTIPDSVTKIGDLAFSSCTCLTSVIIPQSVTKIRGSAFYECEANIIVHPDNPVYASENGKLIEKKGKRKKNLEKCDFF